MNLVRAEVSRFFSRRFIQIMLVVLVALFGITIYTVMSGSRPPTDATWAVATARAEYARNNLAAEQETCLRVNPRSPEVCSVYDPSRIHVENYLEGVFNFRSRIGDLVMMLAVFLGFFGFLVTASFIGSELHSGGMTNLLLWRPHRKAVLGAKFGVGVGLVAAISAIFTVVYVSTFYAIAHTTGLVGAVDADFWAQLIWLGVRANTVGLLMSILAFAIATVGRHTAAALGALIGYVVVWEIGARIVISVLNSYEMIDFRMFLSSHLVAWLLEPWSTEIISDITWQESGIVFAVLGLAATAVAFTSFNRRDLT